MAKGFMVDTDELKIQAAVKRLLPSARRGDVHTFCDGVRRIKARHGHAIADEGMRRALIQFPNLFDEMIDSMPEEMRRPLTEMSFDAMAEVIENAGLRLEDHMRITDDGVGLTKDAVNAIIESGIPAHMVESQGNDSLKGFGIDRTDGFFHPLSEVFDAEITGTPEECTNSWGVASMVISAAQGWIEGNRQNSFEFLKSCALRQSPTTDLDLMMRRSRYDDRVLMKLCSLFANGFDAIARHQME